MKSKIVKKTKKVIKPKAKKAEPVNRRDKKWYAAHLERLAKKRRAAYAKDPGYRQKQIEQSRAAYREKNAVDNKDCRDNIPALKDIGSIRVVKVGAKAKKMLTFDMEQTAQALNCAVVSIYRWVADTRLPKPVMRTFYSGEPGKGQFATQYVYTLPEITAIMNVLGEHQANVTQYRLSHSDTRKAILNAVKSARKGN